MGVVYLARDVRLDRAVALKALPEDFAADPERLARFEREAKILASLSHPNIAGIYGIETAEERRYLALEYIEGDKLCGAAEPRASRAGGGGRDRHPDRRGNRGGSRERGDPPGPQAEQRGHHPERSGEDRGLWPGEGTGGW